ncbi:thiamine-phosphate kinase [Roseibium album]|uniref:thiamine-phosphate kinase n=1 Tax=Roseibium album TaxID=311410 RepID=UPI002491F005|nr:thiamine-phosphate kinase [Roseibium album]MCR9056615.1 thiamine-phosphate kinase [Paracoccaceae bacterium]
MADDRPGEFELIRTYFAPLAKDPGSLGLTDDAAVLSPRPGYDLVLTKDVLASGVHFFAHDAPEAIAAKALRVNLSDLAAKGARPRGYLLGLALPSDWTANWLGRFCSGLTADQSAYNVQLLGGDTIRSGSGLQISITAIGEAEAGKTVRRSGANAGDLVFVSGTIGDAAAGLKARLDHSFCGNASLDGAEERHILDRYLLPRPRTALSGLLTRYATAAMDVSDGLFADCSHMARASGVGFEIEMSSVPISSALQRMKKTVPDVFAQCLNGGDDYEILASVPSAVASEFAEKAAESGCPVTAIGVVTSSAGKVKLIENGRPMKLESGSGFRHF